MREALRHVIGIAIVTTALCVAVMAERPTSQKQAVVVAFVLGGIGVTISFLIDKLFDINKHVVSVRRSAWSGSRSRLMQAAFEIGGIKPDGQLLDHIYRVCESNECNWSKERRLIGLASKHGFILEFVW